MSFVAFNIITDDDLHASLPRGSEIDSSINPASVKAEGGSSSGGPPHPHAGAAAAVICVPANAEGEGR